MKGNTGEINYAIQSVALMSYVLLFLLVIWGWGVLVIFLGFMV